MSAEKIYRNLGLQVILEMADAAEMHNDKRLRVHIVVKADATDDDIKAVLWRAYQTWKRERANGP